MRSCGESYGTFSVSVGFIELGIGIKAEGKFAGTSLAEILV